jgi:hypothetical protein
MKALKSALLIAAFAVSGSAFAGPFDSGFVGGQVKSKVEVGKVNMTNRAGLGYAKQELNVGSINGAKVLGNVDLKVKAKDITMNNRAGLGYATQEANIGSIK